MAFSKCCLGAVLASTLVAGAACGSPVSPSPSGTRAEGQIFSEDSWPDYAGLAGVRIEVMDGPSKGQFTMTGTDGKFSLAYSGTDSVRTINPPLLATKDGWLPLYFLAWEEDGFLRWHRMSQEPHVLSGRVGETPTAGIPGVRLEIVDGPNAGRVAVSDQVGAYRFDNLLTSPPCSVLVSKAGYVTRTVAVEGSHLEHCEWGVVRCGIRSNLSQDFYLTPASNPDR